MSKTINNFKKGDIIVKTYGYDCTLIDFYEVVRTTACGVELRELNQESEGNHSGFCWAVPGSYKSEKTTLYRLKKNGNPNLGAYSYSILWDGKPVRWNSGYQCGKQAEYDEDREIYKKYTEQK